ncbi:efflux transporter outer membrane subunit [Sphingomonas sp. 2R-10]|uniref:efflux transporter outer membrane subunit n=1 Tax=Sphingomonas sp. 2R-10 TaxID=3045148 RepID=UPI0019D21FE9|nr:efflux transporter outer membrane subunit [Sphingomonas sp. 2R-10]MDJ0278396.1 efflux transporter outer membrane subunit [Sphingomonas sp. 2R-10]
MSNRVMTLRTLTLLIATTALTACNLAPKNVRPEGAIPLTLPQGGPYPALDAEQADVTRIAYRDFFVDPRLQAVIATALENNRDYRVTAANVLVARAQYRVTRASQVPSTTVNGGVTYTNNPFGALGGAGGVGGAGGAAGGVPAQTGNLEIYQASVGFSAFELDLFGRVRNLSQAGLQQYFATEEAQRAARIALVGEVATAWLTMAADQDQLRLSRETLNSFGRTLELTRAQFRVGVISELEVQQAETSYQQARNDIAALTAQIAQDQNALNLLAGTTVPLEQLPTELGERDPVLANLPTGVSSTVLLRRPDVLQAERRLYAANANIGAARAALFPTISLTATLGTISTALGGLFGAGTENFSISPTAALPLFDGGQRRGNVEVARAQQVAAVATYEGTLQTAFREVADALATRGTIGEQLSAQTARAQAAATAQRLSDARYRAGIDSFLNTLDAQRTSYAARQTLVQTRLARATNLVTLYRTLGGGLN